jgi:hypothetical protein
MEKSEKDKKFNDLMQILMKRRQSAPDFELRLVALILKNGLVLNFLNKINNLKFTKVFLMV